MHDYRQYCSQKYSELNRSPGYSFRFNLFVKYISRELYERCLLRSILEWNIVSC